MVLSAEAAAVDNPEKYVTGDLARLIFFALSSLI
jgi:hypothetical protein